jgi:hypothetical protein
MSSSVCCSMKLMRCVVFSLRATVFVLQACRPVGSRHTSDAALARTLESHQDEFESICAEFEANSRLITLFAGGNRQDLHDINLAAMERAGLPRERLTHYEVQLQRLGLWSVMKGGRGIEFRVDPGSLSNGDSYKGIFWYREGEPSDVRATLDDYRFSRTDEAVYKALRGHWYLYIFVSH